MSKWPVFKGATWPLMLDTKWTKEQRIRMKVSVEIIGVEIGKLVKDIKWPGKVKK